MIVIFVDDKDIKRFYLSALKQEPSVLIEMLIKQIKLYNDKIEITFNSPIKKSPNDKDSSFLLRVVKEIEIYKEQLEVRKMRIDLYV